MTEVTPPAWTTDVLLSMSELAQAIGENRSTLASRARRPGFPEPTIGSDRSARYRLYDVLEYQAGEGRPRTVFLVDHLVEVAHRRLDQQPGALSDPSLLDREVLRRHLVIRLGRTARAAKEHEPDEPEELDELQPLLEDALAELEGDAAAAMERVLYPGDRLTGGEAGFTPPLLRNLVGGCLAGLRPNRPPTSAYDPCAGEGSLLVEAARSGCSGLYGQELDALARKVVQERLRHVPGVTVDLGAKAGDVFEDDQHLRPDSSFVAFDVVVADLPKHDPWRWLSQVVRRHLAHDGWAVVACPHSVVGEARDRTNLPSFPASRIRAIVRLPIDFRVHHRIPAPTIVVLGPAVPDTVDMDSTSIPVLDLGGVELVGVVPEAGEGGGAPLDARELGGLIAQFAATGRSDAPFQEYAGPVTFRDLKDLEDPLRVARRTITRSDFGALTEALKEAIDAIDGIGEKGAKDETVDDIAERVAEVVRTASSLNLPWRERVRRSHSSSDPRWQTRRGRSGS